MQKYSCYQWSFRPVSRSFCFTLCIFSSPVFFPRFVKFSMPNIPDFETLFSQVQLFISTCNGEHIRYATDTCKSRLTKPIPSTVSSASSLYWFLVSSMSSISLLFMTLPPPHPKIEQRQELDVCFNHIFPSYLYLIKNYFLSQLFS